MKAKEIEWSLGVGGSQTGKVGGISLFTVSYGLTRMDRMYSLGTTLPIRSASIGQVHASAEDAKAAAVRVLNGFLSAVTS